jgi:heme/copper-type cytochrome/quinol oxidase subunit 2
MGIGTSLFLVAVGAILRYAITDAISGVNLEVVGLILMIVGVVGLVISLLALTLWSRRDGETYVRDPRL